MASAVPYQNRLNGHVWFRFTASNTINLVDCNYSNAENVSSLAITKIISTGQWNIARGSNVVWYTSDTNQTFDFVGNGTAINDYANATVVCTYSGTGGTNGSIMIQLSKQTSANGTII